MPPKGLNSHQLSSNSASSLAHITVPVVISHINFAVTFKMPQHSPLFLSKAEAPEDRKFTLSATGTAARDFMEAN